MKDSSLFESIVAAIWPAESLIAQLIVGIIAAMFVWTAWQTLHNALRIERERAALRRAAEILRKWRTALETQGAPGDPQPFPRLSLEDLSAMLAEIRSAAGGQSHIAKLVSAIQTLRVHRMKVNVGSLQQVVEHDEATRPGVSGPAAVANFAVMLGILGTFWGLSQMVTAIGGALPEQRVATSMADWARSVTQIRQVLTGMRTAFSTSLVGMCCSIGAGLCNNYLTSAQQRMLQALEAFTINELLPATVPTLEDDSVLEQVSGQLERAFAHIDDIAQQNRQSLSELHAVQALFRNIVEDIRAITHGDARRDVSDVLEAVMDSNGAVKSLVAELPRLTQAVQRSAAQPGKTFQPSEPALPFNLSAIAGPTMRAAAKGFSPLHVALLLLGGVVVLVLVLVSGR